MKTPAEHLDVAKAAAARGDRNVYAMAVRALEAMHARALVVKATETWRFYNAK